MKRHLNTMLWLGYAALATQLGCAGCEGDPDANGTPWMLDKDACMEAACVDAAPDLKPGCTDECLEDMSSVDLEDMSSVGPDLSPPWEVPEGMVEVPEGAFLMGTPPEVNGSAAFLGHGEHEVWLSRYAIDVLEVSVQDYQQCVAQGACIPSGPDDEGHEQCNTNFPDRGDHPINCVDWSQALAYCEFRGFTLPTEAQWEKAARGPDVFLYPWGDEPYPSCENSIVDGPLEDEATKGPGCGRGSTWPGGSREQDLSGYGIKDMAGNLSEWTWDWYDREYYMMSPERDPRGPESSKSVFGERTVRGGQWQFGGTHSSIRYRRDPKYRSVALGFRCAKNSIPIP